MVKKGRLNGIILKALKIGALNVSEIRSSINESEEYESLSEPEKTFKETLVRLIRDDEIYILGYDIPDRTHKDFNFDNLIFSLVKKDRYEIEDLILKLLNSDRKESRNAEWELEKLFNSRLSELSLKRESDWEKAEENLVTSELPDRVILWLEATRALENDVKLKNQNLTEDECKRTIEFYMKSLDNEKNLFNLRKKYSYLKIRSSKDDIVENFLPLTNPNEFDIFKWYYIIPDKNLSKEEIKNHQLAVQGLTNRSDEEKDALFKSEKPFSDDYFLKKKPKVLKPKIRNSRQVEALCDKIIKYLKFGTSKQKFFIEKLSYALSDDEEAEELLDEIVKEVTNNKDSLYAKIS